MKCPNCGDKKMIIIFKGRGLRQCACPECNRTEQVEEEKPQRVFCTWCRGTYVYHNKPCTECREGVQELE